MVVPRVGVLAREAAVPPDWRTVRSQAEALLERSRDLRVAILWLRAMLNLEGFVALASSPDCKVQAMRSLKRPLFGLQFHPEVENTQHGYEVFQNFLKACEG